VAICVQCGNDIIVLKIHTIPGPVWRLFAGGFAEPVANCASTSTNREAVDFFAVIVFTA
jgi:hypothetical protein